MSFFSCCNCDKHVGYNEEHYSLIHNNEADYKDTFCSLECVKKYIDRLLRG